MVNIIIFFLVTIAAIFDVKKGIIPDKLIAAGLFLAVAAMFYNYCTIIETTLAGLFAEMLLGFCAGGLPIFAVIVLTKGAGIGGGDMKLFATIGAFVGAKLVLLIVLLSIVTCGIVSLFLIIIKVKTMKSSIKFAPFIAFSTICVLYFEQQILQFFIFYT